MTAILLDVVSGAFIFAGSFFVLVGAIGLFRLPDVFTRMHAASVTETAGAGLICIGLMFQAGPTLITAKLIFILALLFFTGPVITHALAQAAFHAGIKPILAEDRRARLEDDRALPSPMSTVGTPPTSVQPKAER